MPKSKGRKGARKYTSPISKLEQGTRRPTIFICVPAYGGNIRQETMQAIDNAVLVLTKAGVGHKLYVIDMCDVIEVRTCALTAWFDGHPDCSHMLMIDNDMEFSALLPLKMLALDKPVVGVIYARREMPPVTKEGQLDLWKVVVGHPIPNENPPIVNGFQRWQRVGGGVLLIKRETVAAMLEHLPDQIDWTDPGRFKATHIDRKLRLFDPMRAEPDPGFKEGAPLSEDLAFSERARQAGLEVWAAVDEPINHIGTYAYPMHALSMLQLDKSLDELEAQGQPNAHGIGPDTDGGPNPSFGKEVGGHTSDCATNNAPALPVGPCDCGPTIGKAVGA